MHYSEEPFISQVNIGNYIFLFKTIAIFFVKCYQYGIRPLLPNACRYTPSCSEFSIESIKKYGAIKGAWLGLKRISRCHPWGGQGYDPVP